MATAYEWHISYIVHMDSVRNVCRLCVPSINPSIEFDLDSSPRHTCGIPSACIGLISYTQRYYKPCCCLFVLFLILAQDYLYR